MTEPGEVRGVYWQVDKGEISEKVQFRIGYQGSEHYDAYFPMAYLSDAISTLTAVRSAGLDVLIRGTYFQAFKTSRDFHNDVSFGYLNGVGPEIRFYVEVLSDLISTLTAFQTAAPSLPAQDWDENVRSYGGGMSQADLDQSVADLINTDGSAVDNALSATIDAKTEQVAFSPLDITNGTLPASGKTASGHHFVNTKSAGAGFVLGTESLTAASGLVYLDAGPVSGPIRVLSLKARWTDEGQAPASSETAVGIISKNKYFAADYPDYDAAGLHILHRPQGFVVQNRSAGAGGANTIGTPGSGGGVFHNYATPLAFGVWHTLTALWDGYNLRVVRPDGVIVDIAVNDDSRAWWGSYACIEIVADPTRNGVELSRSSYASASPARTTYEVVAASVPASKQVTSPGTVSTALTSSLTTVATMSIVVPPSKCIRVMASIPLTHVSGTITVGIDVAGNGTSSSGNNPVITGSAGFDGNLTVFGVCNFSEFTAGTTQTLNIKLASTGTTTFKTASSGPARRVFIDVAETTGTFV